MTFRRSVLSVGAVVLGVLPVIACGSDRSGVATAPSSALSTPAVEQSVVSSGAHVSAADTSNAITSLVAGTSCPTLQFKISTYLIKTDGATRYEGGTCASLQAGTKITLTATRLGSDNEQTVYASQITILPGTTTPTPTPPPANPTTPVQTEVTITGVTGTCPDVTFMVSRYAFKVSSSTGYSGSTCADLKAGVKVSVVGTKRESDSFIVVTGIGIKRADTPTRPAEPVEGEGVITSLSGGTVCPTLQFFVGTYLITLDASTLFDHGACSDLTIGKRVHVKGGLTGDGSVLATKISVQSDSPGSPVVEGDGKVSSLVSGTACPVLKFLIEEYTVTLNASTTFVGGSCHDVAAGNKLGVKGTVTGDKQVLATQIVFKNGN